MVCGGNKYIEEAVSGFSINLNESGRNIYGKADSVMRTMYLPELYVLPVLGDDQGNYYQNLIGLLKLTVELDFVDIHVVVALLSWYIAQTQK